MQDRTNTIAGWILFAMAVALGGSLVAGEVYHSGRPEKMGYPIEGVVEEGAGAAEAEKPIEFFLASADPAKGADVFKKCAACHNVDKGGANALGPNLWAVMGEAVGKGKGYAFSDALAAKGGNWDWVSMSAWLKSPKTFANGTKMTFAGLSNPEERANVIAYLNSKSDAPLPMPAAPAEAAPAADAAAPADAAKANAEAQNGAGAQKAENEPVLTEQQAATGGSKNVGGEGAAKLTGPKGVATR